MTLSIFSKQIPMNVWVVAGMIRIGLAKRGIEILPRDFLTPDLCPRCSTGKIEEDGYSIRCSSCGYSRANITKRGYNVTLGELLDLANELLHNAASGALINRLRNSVRLR